ncbi:hypothetical protein [Priestia aryabhattai]
MTKTYNGWAKAILKEVGIVGANRVIKELNLEIEKMSQPKEQSKDVK